MDVSGRPTTSDSSHVAFSFFVFAVLVLCIVECVTLRNAKVMESHQWTVISSQTHTRQCQTHMFSTLCDSTNLFSFQSLCDLPSFPASPLEHMLLIIKNHIWPLVTRQKWLLSSISFLQSSPSCQRFLLFLLNLNKKKTSWPLFPIPQSSRIASLQDL